MHRCVHLYTHAAAVIHLKERHCVILVAWFPLDAMELLETA